jgi:hypothetical protein
MHGFQATQVYWECEESMTHKDQGKQGEATRRCHGLLYHSDIDLGLSLVRSFRSIQNAEIAETDIGGCQTVVRPPHTDTLAHDHFDPIQPQFRSPGLVNYRSRLHHTR